MINKIFVKQFKQLSNRNVFGVRYTRQFFRQQIINAEQIQKQEQQKKKIQFQNQIYNLKSNDKNPNNYVKVKINDPLFFHKKPQTTKQPYILFPTPRPPRVLIAANRRFILTSLKKMKAAFANIKKIHFTEAIHLLKNSQKKVAKLILPTFYNLIDHAKNKGLDPMRLYVHGIIMGKKKRIRGIRYKAKGSSGMETSDMCQAKVILYQKPIKQFYRDLVLGKKVQSIVTELKSELIQSNANAQKISQFQNLLSSRARQQFRQIIRRKTQIKFAQNSKANIYIPKKVIQNEIIDSYAKRLQQSIENLKQTKNTLKLREQLYKKNIQGN